MPTATTPTQILPRKKGTLIAIREADLDRALAARVAADESGDKAAFDRALAAEREAEKALSAAVAQYGRLVPGLPGSLGR